MRLTLKLVSIVVIASTASHVYAASTEVTVIGTSGPWLWHSAGLNSSFSYGENDQGSPTIVTSASGISITPAQQLEITYLSGTEVAGVGFGAVGAQGTSSLANNLNTDGVFPSFYMPANNYPIYLSELVGTFADSSGSVVGTPFPVGLSAVVTVPKGASQLQLGINDNKFVDNTGFFQVQINSLGLLGDANLNGIVDLNDLNTVLNNLGRTSSLRTDGNFDGAATVDLTDLNDVLNNLGVSSSATSELLSTNESSTAPEPASLSIASISAVILASRKKNDEINGGGARKIQRGRSGSVSTLQYSHKRNLRDRSASDK